MTLAIRKAHSHDAPALMELLQEIGWFHFVNTHPAETVLARVQQHLDLCLADDSHSLYVVQDGAGRIIGYANVHWLPYLFHPAPLPPHLHTPTPPHTPDQYP